MSTRGKVPLTYVAGGGHVTPTVGYVNIRCVIYRCCTPVKQTGNKGYCRGRIWCISHGRGIVKCFMEIKSTTGVFVTLNQISKHREGERQCSQYIRPMSWAIQTRHNSPRHLQHCSDMAEGELARRKQTRDDELGLISIKLEFIDHHPLLNLQDALLKLVQSRVC